jgi:hypothetical protein
VERKRGQPVTGLAHVLVWVNITVWSVVAVLAVVVVIIRIRREGRQP